MSENSFNQFRIDAQDVRTVQRIIVGHDNKGEKPGWHLDWIDISKGNERWRLNWNKWLAGDAPDSQVTQDNRGLRTVQLRVARQAEYLVSVMTSDVANAGTNARIWVTLIGPWGDTGECALPGRFERNGRDEIRIDAKDVGVVQRIVVGHDNKGEKPGWHLQWIKITKDNERYRLDWNKWLAADVPDAQVIRDSGGLRTGELPLTKG